MNKEQQDFLDSIRNKIKKYKIEITLKEALEYGRNLFVITKYGNGKEELVDIGIEKELCRRSAYYFLSSYAVFKVVGLGVIPYEPYYFQAETLKQLPKLKKTVFVKSRQVGISTTTSLYALWKVLFNHGETVVIIIKTQKATSDYMDTMRPTIDNLPEFLKVGILLNNQKELKFENKSRVICEAASENAGRSGTASLLILDEAAFYKTDRLCRKIVASAMPALVASDGDLIGISTPNGVNNWYYEQVQELKLSNQNPKNKLIEIEWWNVPDRPGLDSPRGFNDILTKYEQLDYFNNNSVFREAKEFFKPIEKNWRENLWLKRAHEDLGDVLFRQEILHNFTVTDSTVFDEAVIEKVAEKIRTFKILEENTLNGKPCKGLTIWNYPEPGKRYILAADIASGTAKDYSTIQVLDAERYEQVAEFQGKLTTKNMGRLLRRIGLYYNEGYIVIESNSIGEAVFNELYYNEEHPYNNMYKQKITQNNVTKFTSWTTNVKTRQLLVNNFVDWVSVDDLFDQVKIKSLRLLEEMTTWIYSSDGRIDHAEGKHDDLIIAFALCLYLRNKATHSGASFLINEDNKTVTGEETPGKVNKSYEQERNEDDLVKSYGVEDIDQLKWLLGMN